MTQGPLRVNRNHAFVECQTVVLYIDGDEESHGQHQAFR